MTLKEIIKHLQEVIKETDLGINDAVLFEQAIKIMISRQIGEQKKENIAQYTQRQEKCSLEPSKPEFKGEFNRVFKVTDKQKNFLKKLGFPGDIDVLSKNDAKIAIDELIKRRNK